MKLNLKSKYTDVVDYVFWISFILFTNPGGILEALGEDSGDGGIDVTDLLYGVMLVCFLFVYRRANLNNDISIKKIRNYVVIFLMYYFVVFSYLIPLFRDNPFYSPMVTIIKIRHSVIHMSLVFIVYEFYLRSYPIFIKFLLYSSIIIIILFIISVYTGVEILPVIQAERRFITTKRLFMESYGLLPLLIPMGIVILIFKFKIKYRKLMIVGFSLMFLVWLFSIFRRHIIGTVIYLIIGLFFYNYLHRKPLVDFKKTMSIFIYSIILLFLIQLTFPEYIQATVDAMEETVHVIKYGKTSMGKEDVRLGAGKEFLQNIISKNYFFGTGFDNRWRSLVGNKAGYEASDYPFLGAIAMYGVLGLLIFLPVYIVLIKALRYDIKYLRKNGYSIYSFEAFMLVLFIIYFIFDLLQYINWFLPLSVIMDPRWYIFLGIYLASRKLYYDKEELNKSQKAVY